MSRSSVFHLSTPIGNFAVCWCLFRHQSEGNSLQTAITFSSIEPDTIRKPQGPVRNIALDAYRGFVMFLMMAEVLRLSRVAAALPGTGFGVSSPTIKRTSIGRDVRCTTSFNRVLISGRRCIALLDCRRLAKGGTFRSCSAARALAVTAVDRARRLSAIDARHAN